MAMHRTCNAEMRVRFSLGALCEIGVSEMVKRTKKVVEKPHLQEGPKQKVEDYRCEHCGHSQHVGRRCFDETWNGWSCHCKW